MQRLASSENFWCNVLELALQRANYPSLGYARDCFPLEYSSVDLYILQNVVMESSNLFGLLLPFTFLLFYHTVKGQSCTVLKRKLH